MMMMKGSSSSNLLCALGGLAVLLCVVNEAQGLTCWQTNGGSDEVEWECKAACSGVRSCAKRVFKYDTGGKALEKGCICGHPKHECNDGRGTDHHVKLCTCLTDLCNVGGIGDPWPEKPKDENQTGRAATPTLAFSTLIFASALAIITSA